jgi:hypothetical protein
MAPVSFSPISPIIRRVGEREKGSTTVVGGACWHVTVMGNLLDVYEDIGGVPPRVRMRALRRHARIPLAHGTRSALQECRCRRSLSRNRLRYAQHKTCLLRKYQK